MAVTGENQSIAPDQWYSIHDLTGIGISKKLSVHNLSNNLMKISVAEFQPAVNNDNWLLLFPQQPATIHAGEAEVWVFGAGVLNVQELT